MGDFKDKTSNAVLGNNPLAFEQKLLMNKKCKTLDELRQSFKPETSSVLSQVRDFLPKLALANEDLQKRLEVEPAHTFDIEHIDVDQPHVEMDLALFEENSSEEEDDGSDLSDSEEEFGEVEITENNLKLTKDLRANKPQPMIQVLSETDIVNKESQSL